MPLIPREAGEEGIRMSERMLLREGRGGELTKLVFQSGTVYNSIGHIISRKSNTKSSRKKNEEFCLKCAEMVMVCQEGDERESFRKGRPF